MTVVSCTGDDHCSLCRDRCPACTKNLSPMIADNNIPHVTGDILICPDCFAVLTFDTSLSLATADLASFTSDDLQAIEQLTLQLKAKMQRLTS